MDIHVSLQIPVYCILTDGAIIVQCMGHLSEGMITFRCTVIRWLWWSVSPWFIDKLECTLLHLHKWMSSCHLVFLYNICYVKRNGGEKGNQCGQVQVIHETWPHHNNNHSPDTGINVSAIIWESSSVKSWNYSKVSLRHDKNPVYIFCMYKNSTMIQSISILSKHIMLWSIFNKPSYISWMHYIIRLLLQLTFCYSLAGSK